MRTRYVRTGGVLAAVAASLAIAACGSSSSSNSSKPAATSYGYGAGLSGSSAATTTAKAVAVSAKKGPDGSYLTGASGRALYLWVADSAGHSSCAGECAKAWPPLIAKGTPTAGSGAVAADLGTITRTDGTKQVTYKGHPLYYYIGDTGPGMLNGQGSNGFGAKWWLVTPSGSAITSTKTVSSS